MIDKKLQQYARELRNNLTPAEAGAWKLLKAKQLDGRKFRRQQVIGNYIVDFYCYSEHLAIELDGVPHNSTAAKKYDLKRDSSLLRGGVKVIRFKNRIVFENPEFMTDTIRASFGWQNETG